MKNLKNNFWALFSLLLIVLLFFWKVVIKGFIPIPGDFIVGVYYPWLDYKWGYAVGVPVKNPITSDVISFIYPMQTFAMSLFKSGRWPLWNPYILAGSPLLANLQSAPFAPTSLFYFFLDKTSAWSVQVVLQHIFAALFTYLLLRHWKISKLGSILGGVVYAFSGYNLIFSEWNGHTLAASFLPLILLFEDRFLERGKFLDGATLSILLALQLFSGYAQTSVYTAVAIGILWFVSIYKDKKWFLKTATLGLFCLLSIGLSAVQIVPSLELIENSQRSFEPHPYEWAFLPWEKIITLISSDYFGNHATHNYWGPQDYTSNTGYVGVVAFILATVGGIVFRKRKEVLFLIILAVTSLVLSFPTPIAVFIWENDILGMKANSAHRATILFCAAIAFLSGFGLDALLSKQKITTKVISLTLPFITLLGFGIYAFLIREKTVFDVSIFLIAARNLILPIGIFTITAVIILFKPKYRYAFVVLAVIELFYFGWKYTPFSPRDFVYPETPIISFLKSQQKPYRVTGAKVIPSNLRMAYGIEAPEGYDTFHPLNMSRFIAAINSGTTKSLPVGRYGIVDNDASPLLDLVNTKYYVALKIDEERFKSKRFQLVFSDKSVSVFESKTVLPRAFMFYDWEIEKDDIKVLDKLLDDYPIDKKIILSQDYKGSKSSGNINNEVKYLTYEDQTSVISVDTQSTGLLFVSDAYYPGWKAYVDGNEVEIYRADSAFRAIEVPKGLHVIKFIYRPESFYKGLKISLISLLTLPLIFAVYSVVGRKRT